MKKNLVIPFILLIMHSCSFAPQYHQPCMEMPDAWRVDSDETSTIANLLWWEQFNDPILNSLIAEALNNNNDLKVAVARVFEYRALWGIASSALLPQVYGNFAAYRTRTSLQVALPTPADQRTFDNFNPYLSASWELDIWGRIRNASEAALEDYLGQIEARRTVVLTVVTDVASSYVTLRQYDKQLAISKRTQKSREESLKLAIIRFKGGITSDLEVNQAKSEVQAALAEVKRFEALIQQEENFLSVLVGHVPTAIERGLDLDDLSLPPSIPTGIPSEILTQRPDIIQAETAIIAANARIGQARAEFFPQITLTGVLGAQSEHLKDLLQSTAQMWQYGSTLLQPIFTGFRLINQVDVAEARKAMAYFQYKNTVLNALREVNDALIGHQKSKELQEVQYERIKAVREYLRLATLQYHNGQVDYLNVLDAERSLFGVELAYTQSQSDMFLTLISLYKALGGGWVIDADHHILGGACSSLPILHVE